MGNQIGGFLCFLRRLPVKGGSGVLLRQTLLMLMWYYVKNVYDGHTSCLKKIIVTMWLTGCDYLGFCENDIQKVASVVGPTSAQHDVPASTRVMTAEFGAVQNYHRSSSLLPEWSCAGPWSCAIVCHIGRTRTASALPSIRIVRAVMLYLSAYHEVAVTLFVRMFVNNITPSLKFASLIRLFLLRFWGDLGDVFWCVGVVDACLS